MGIQIWELFAYRWEVTPWESVSSPREFLGVRRAPGRKSGENQELRVVEDY